MFKVRNQTLYSCRHFLNSYYQTGLKNLLDVAVLEAVDEQIKIQKLRYKKLDEVPF